MLELYKKLAARYPEYLFGYEDRAGMFWQISVIRRKGGMVAKTQLEHGLTPKEYAIAYLDLLKSLGADIGKKPDQPTQQTRTDFQSVHSAA